MWQCEPLNPKPQNPQHSEHVRHGTITRRLRADMGAKWFGTTGNVSGRPKPLEKCPRRRPVEPFGTT